VPKKRDNTPVVPKRRKTQRQVSRSQNILSKTQSTQLKRALNRYKKRQNVTQLMDHAVPEKNLFTGMLGVYHLSHNPNVGNSREHETSPFVLSLKPIAQPEEVLEHHRAVRVNLMYGRSTLEPETVAQVDHANDLALTQEEIHEQLAEEALAHHGWSPMSLPTATVAQIHAPILNAITETEQQTHALRKTTTETPFSSEAFVPQSLPEDIFAYFDFPEDEEVVQEEADVITLDEIDSEPEEIATPKTKKIAWPKLPSIKRPLHQPIFQHSWQRAIASFVALSFVVVFPLHAMNVAQDLRETKASVEASGVQAVSLLSEGAQAALARDTAHAGNSFTQATAEFQSARESIQDLGLTTELLLATLPVTGSSYKSGQALITAGEKLAIAGERIADGYAAMEQELQPTPISRLNLLETYLMSALPHLEDANEALADVNLNDIPEAHQATLAAAQSSLPALIQTIEEFESFYSLAKIILGGEGTKRYLLLFQNITEVRPTGGFPGSFAEIKVHDGVIEQLHVPGGGTYDLQGQLSEDLAAPKPLQLLRARWEFQDANWFADFPTSARQFLQFYEDAGGPSVDGVLAVNSSLIAELIGLLGPIEMEEYGRVINQDNFMFETQRIVEYEYDKEENTPKAFIGDLAPILVNEAIEKTSEDFLSIVDFLNRGLSEKELQIYLSDQELQRQIIDHGWGGEVKWTDHDYLMVSNTNLGGGKTDGVIQEDIQVDVEIQADGSIINTVTIDRTHYGIQGLMFTGVNNVNYTRIHVPQGSELLEATGFNPPDSSLFEEPEEDWGIDDDLAYIQLTEEMDLASGTRITQESGKTVFGNWVQTKPGTTSTVSVQYKLPFTLQSLDTSDQTFMATLKSLAGIPQTDEYTLTIQKQPGVLDRTTTVTLNAPEELTTLWQSETNTFTNRTDAHFATLFESL
jgi:hypothetical protein